MAATGRCGSTRARCFQAGLEVDQLGKRPTCGEITSDTRSGTAYAYTYNKRNRLATVTVGGNLKGTYT